MKILFVGLGSIGQRHLRNCKMLLDKASLDLIAYRTSSEQNIIENGKSIECGNLAKHYGFLEFRSFAQAIKQCPDVSFICNPSKLHMETAVALAETGSALFIEKPLATDITLLERLEEIISDKKLITMVGFQTRFHPCIEEAKRILEEKQFGSVISAQFNWSTYLPYHHQYEDYRKSYAARKDLGGGVTFCLSHELDLIQYFFGLPISLYAIEGGKSKLEIDTEDTVSVLFRCREGVRTYPVSLHLSFAQRVEKRNFFILVENGCVECDLQNNKLQVTNHEQKIVYDRTFVTLQRNDLFLEEIKHFFNCLAAQSETGIPVSEGKKSLSMALAIHKSICTDNAISLVEYSSAF